MWLRGSVVAGAAALVMASGGPVAAAEPQPDPPSSASSAAGSPVTALGEIKPKPGSRKVPLRWQPCSDVPGMQCARHVVPLDWQDARKGAVSLAVRRWPALGKPRDVLGTIFVNPGGPGESGTEFLKNVQRSEPLRGRFHLVSWDPRGVASTTPRLKPCPETPGVDGQKPVIGVFTWPQASSSRYQQEARSNATCLAANRGLSRFVGTNDSVQDLESLRAAVGDSALTFVGYDYGTTLGRAYAMKYPAKVRAMVLDGVTDPTMNAYRELSNAGLAATAGLPMIADTMSLEIQELYLEVEDYLSTHTINVDGSVVTRWSFWSLATYASLTPDTLDQLPDAICFIAENAGLSSPACVSSLGSKGALRSLTSGLHSLALGSPTPRLMMCGDQSGRVGPVKLGDWSEYWDDEEGSEVATNVLNLASQCSGMPSAWNRVAPLIKTKLRTPPLLVNSAGDFVTPLRNARATRAGFPGSRLISLNATFHGVFLRAGSSCVDGPVRQYLITRALPAHDVSCPAP